MIFSHLAVVPACLVVCNTYAATRQSSKVVGQVLDLDLDLVGIVLVRVAELQISLATVYVARRPSDCRVQDSDQYRSTVQIPAAAVLSSATLGELFTRASICHQAVFSRTRY